MPTLLLVRPCPWNDTCLDSVCYADRCSIGFAVSKQDFVSWIVTRPMWICILFILQTFDLSTTTWTHLQATFGPFRKYGRSRETSYHLCRVKGRLITSRIIYSAIWSEQSGLIPACSGTSIRIRRIILQVYTNLCASSRHPTVATPYHRSDVTTQTSSWHKLDLTLSQWQQLAETESSAGKRKAHGSNLAEYRHWRRIALGVAATWFFLML